MAEYYSSRILRRYLNLICERNMQILYKQISMLISMLKSTFLGNKKILILYFKVLYSLSNHRRRFFLFLNSFSRNADLANPGTTAARGAIRTSGTPTVAIVAAATGTDSIIWANMRRLKKENIIL